MKTESNDEVEDGEDAEGTGGKDGLAMTPCAVRPLREVTESARVSHDPAVNELPRRASEAEDFERGGGAASFEEAGCRGESSERVSSEPQLRTARKRGKAPLWQEDLVAAQELIRKSSRSVGAKESLGGAGAVVACDGGRKTSGLHVENVPS